MICPIDPKPLQPPLRTEEFETLFHLLKVATICQDLVPLLIYQIDTVDNSVLVHIAEQLDVLGYKGWLLADTETKQRDLIRSAVALHRKAATPSAIIDALSVVDIDVEIIENPCLLYDGIFKYDGTEYYNQRRWDRFIVVFSAPIPIELQPLVDGLIEAWKNARSNRFIPFSPLQYDGSFSYNGEEIYDAEKDSSLDISVYSGC